MSSSPDISAATVCAMVRSPGSEPEGSVSGPVGALLVEVGPQEGVDILGAVLHVRIRLPCRVVHW